MSTLCKDRKTELLICGYIRRYQYLPDSLIKLCISFYGFIVSKEYKVMITGANNTNKQYIIAMDNVITNESQTEVLINKYATIDNETYLLDILIAIDNRAYTRLQEGYLIGSQGYIVVYSVTSRTSFDEAWIKREKILRSHEIEEPPIILVANNIEQKENRQVSEAEGRQLAREWGDYSSYIEISTRDRINCEECIQECARLLVQHDKDPRHNYRIHRSNDYTCCLVL